jgi:hypothetical protein
MGKKSKAFTTERGTDPKQDSYVPGWFGGTLTTPKAQRMAKERLKNSLRERVLLFETARRGTVDADTAPVFPR